MANIVETVNYDSAVYLIATNDAVLGGTNGIANKAATNLANRTAYLKSQVDTINALTPTLAPLLSPTLTGTPKTAAPSIGDSSVQIATTAFVQATSKGRIAINVAGSANVTLSAVQAGYAFIEFTGALTGNITITVPGSASSWIMRNSTSGSYSITLKSATAGGTTMDLPQTGSQKVLTDGTNVYGLGYLPLTGGMVSPSGSTNTASAWAALNTPTLRVADAYSGTGGGLSIESYQPTIQLIDQTANAKNMRLLMDNGVLKIANDPGDNSGVWNTSGFALNADGYMTVGGGVTSPSNNVAYYANGVSLSTSTTAYGFFHAQEFNETTTGGGYAFTAAPKVKASAFTMGNLIGFYANTPTIGSGATVGTYTGVYVQDFSGAGTNYGVRSRMSSGNAKWNLYLDGSASNHLSGTLLIGTTTDNGTDKLQVAGSISATGTVKGVAAQKALIASNGSGAGQTSIYLSREGAPTDEKYWEVLHTSGGSFVVRSINDVYSVSQNALAINRPTGGGTALTTMQLMQSGGRVLVGAAADDGATLLQVAGAITATTATAGTNTTRVATTAFVVNAKNGATTVNVAGNANVTLTATQAGVGIILLTGALTGSITVYVPPGTGQYIIANNTTGAYTLNVGVSGASGATAIIPQSNSVVAYSDGTNVVLAGAASTSAFTRYWFTASAGQSTFNAIYTVGNVLVTVNGAVQAPSDVTATNSATVTLTGYNGGAGCLGGEEVEIIAFSSFSVANAMTPAGGTFSGPVMLAGGDTGVTAAQFDNTTKLATTAFVQRALGSLANDITLSASTTLTAANVGQNVRVFGSSGVVTLTLPASGTLPNAGSGIWISNLSTFNVTIVTQGSDNFSVTAATSMTLLPNDAIFLVNKNTAWTQLAGSGQLQTAGSFAKSLSTSGYQKLPSGLIIQWGPVAQIAANSSVVVSFPIAYPNAALATVVTAGATASGSPVINGINGAGGGNAKANFQVWNSSASVVTQPGNFISIGY